MTVAGELPGGVLVFTDLDETLIAHKSLIDFLHFYFAERYGDAGARHAADTARRVLGAAASGTPREDANRAFYEAWRGEREAAVADWGRRWFARRSRDPGFYLPRVRAAMRAHLAVGDRIVLVTGSFPAVADPVAEDVGAADVLCSRPEARGGVLTGALDGPPCVGDGKRQAVRALMARHPHVRPRDCHGYGDHESDLPMLTEVGHPVVVGANAALAARLPGARTMPGLPTR